MRRIDSRQDGALAARPKLSAAQGRVPGALNKLTLELQSGPNDGGGESFYLYSEHHVRLLSESESTLSEQRPPPYSAAQRQKSQSATPSPQKMHRHRASVLLHWTLRLCQRLDRSAAAAAVDGSDTEDDDSDEDDAAADRRRARCATAWYTVRVNPTSARNLCDELRIERWDELESHIRTAWELGRVDVLVPGSAKQEDNDTETDGDGRYPDVCLSFMLEDVRKEHYPSNNTVKKEDEDGNDGDGADTRLMLTLTRLDDVSAMDEASFVAIEMMSAFGTLKTRTQSLVEERDSHRKLLKDNRRHERFKEASTSLINPGRIKRKVQDDEGFEDE